MIPEQSASPIFIGTAGWSIPPALKDMFPGEGTHLTRYSQNLNAVEINSSFYREHKADTYAKWAQSVPEDFRFSVKLLRYFTQEKRLKETGGRLQEIVSGMSFLGKKWGVLLVQLPPSLEFQKQDVEVFLSDLRKFYSGSLVWEPRHKSWAEEAALDLLKAYRVHKVMADPEPVFVSRSRREQLAKDLIYFRLHGSPQIYKSRYSKEIIDRVALRMREANEQGKNAWCIFDNTTFGFATENALELKMQLNLNRSIVREANRVQQGTLF